MATEVDLRRGDVVAGRDNDPEIIAVENFGVAYGEKVILADISFSLSTVDVVALMGPGGTGKSTLLGAIAGRQASLRRRQWGRIHYFGELIEVSKRAPALMHQHPRDLGRTVWDGFADVVRGHSALLTQELREHIEGKLHALGASELISSFDMRVIDLPLGQARMVAIVRASFSDSPLLLMDEPTTGLSAEDAARVLSLITQLGRERACLVVLHNQQHARQIAQRVILIAGGHVQVDATCADFFENRATNPILAQFLRTGSCCVPAPDAQRGDLDERVALPPPLPVASQQSVAPHQMAEWRDGNARANSSSQRSVQSSPDVELEFLDPVPLENGSVAPLAGALPASRGPNGFHWIIPGRLAGCPMPGVVQAIDHDMALLRAMGVTLLINLTERAMQEVSLERNGMRSYHVSVPDRHAPPLLWAKLLLAKMEGFLRNGEVIAVHCLAGLGRTGTVLGAWLVREGLTADEALRRLRLINAGFVQSKEQEDLLHELEANLLIRAS